MLFVQGGDDKFLHDQLLPHKFEEACKSAKVPLLLRLQPGYDHSYFFISTFIDDHIRHHAQALNQPWKILCSLWIQNRKILIYFVRTLDHICFSHVLPQSGFSLTE